MLTIGDKNTIQTAGDEEQYIADALCCCVDTEPIGWGIRREYICSGDIAFLVDEQVFEVFSYFFIAWGILKDLRPNWLNLISAPMYIGSAPPQLITDWSIFWAAREKEIGILYYECHEGVVRQRLVVWASRDVAPESFTPTSLTPGMESALCDDSDLYDHIRLWYMVTCYKDTWRWGYPRFKNVGTEEEPVFAPLFPMGFGLGSEWILPSVSFVRPTLPSLAQFPRFVWITEQSFTPMAGPLLSTVATPKTTGDWVSTTDAWNGVTGLTVDYGNIWGHAQGQRLAGSNRRPRGYDDVTQIYTWIIDLPVAEENRRNCAIPGPLPDDIPPDDWRLTRRVPWYVQPPDDFAWPPSEWREYCSGQQGPFVPGNSGGGVSGCNATFVPPPVDCLTIEIVSPPASPICQSVLLYDCVWDELAGDYRWTKTDSSWECDPPPENILPAGWNLVEDGVAMYVSRRRLTRCGSRCARRTQDLKPPPVPFPCPPEGPWCKVIKVFGDQTKTFTINSLTDCTCGESGGVFVGVLPPGTYRVTYESGAARTNPDRNWNASTGVVDNGCGFGNWINMIGTSSAFSPLSGFNTDGWATASEAEAANQGTFIDFVVSVESAIYAWYSDNGCGDNSGSISYSISGFFTSIDFDCVEELTDQAGWYDDGVFVANPETHVATSCNATWIGYFSVDNCEEADCSVYEDDPSVPSEPPWDFPEEC